jgi:hypothetical protein
VPRISSSGEVSSAPGSKTPALLTNTLMSPAALTAARIEFESVTSRSNGTTRSSSQVISRRVPA